MVPVEDYLLGNGALHERFFATTEILARLVSKAPRAVSVAQLEEATGRSPKELIKLCGGLMRAGLLRQAPDAGDRWTLACDASSVTLEDVFRCVLAEQHGRARPSRTASERVAGDVDLLVTQAMIAINQSVFKQLRQFSLDRLKASAAGVFPAPRRQFNDAGPDEGFDLALPGRESSYVSPMQIPA